MHSMRIFIAISVVLILASSHAKVLQSILSSTLRPNIARELPAEDAPIPVCFNTVVTVVSENSSIKENFGFTLHIAIMQYIRDALVTVSKQVSGFADYFREAAYTSYFNINNYLFGGVVPTTQTATDEPVYSTIPNGSLIWRDVPATAIEYSAISSLRGHIHTTIKGGNAHRWYSKATDIELLRFLRSQDGSVERTWQQLQAHVTWRSTSYGADSSFTRNSFINSPLHHEVFWLGLNTEGIPTLVVRTQVHDTIYYNHDPAVYESFIVSVIEKGRKLYGVGSQRPMCILIDRGGTVRRNGEYKVETRDMTIVPHIAELVRSIVATVQNHYPDLLHSVKVAPASWFFSMCFKITSAVMDAETRAKFEFIQPNEVAKLHAFLPQSMLPAHLGGSSSVYKSIVDIEFIDEQLKISA